MGSCARHHAARPASWSDAAWPIQRADLLDVAVVVDDHPAVLGEHAPGAQRPEQQRHLGERLRLQGARGERCRADQPGPRRQAARGVEQVVGEAPVAESRQTRTFKPGGRHAAGGDSQRADRLPGERVLDLDLVGLQLRADAADREVPAAVDHEARVAARAGARRVGAQPLAGAAGVELTPAGRRTVPLAIVDRYPPPELLGVRARRAPRRRRGERLLERRRRTPSSEVA